MVARFLIYGLVDPRTNEVRYIGKSTRGLSRPKEHRKKSANTGEDHKSRWIRSLLAAGLEYQIRVLEEVADEDAEHLGLFERYWIAQAREVGWRLTNATDGGDGTPGLRCPEERRARISAAKRGKKLSAEVRARMSAAQRKRPMTPSRREKIVNGTRKYWLGRKHTPESLAKMSAAHKGREVSVEQRRKISAASGGRPVLDVTTGIVYQTAAEAAAAIGAPRSTVHVVLHRGPKAVRGHVLVFAPCEAKAETEATNVLE
jgi:hypothetical protein